MHGCHIECEPVTEESLAAAGSPIYDDFKANFVWHVKYGDEEPETAQIRAITAGPLEGVVVEGTDRATRPTPSAGMPAISPAKMPATIIRPEKRVKAKRDK